MPIIYRIDKERGCIYSDFTGKIEFKEFIQAMNKLFRDPGYKPSYCELFDFSACDYIEINYQKMKTIVEKEQRERFFTGRPKAAFVARKTVIKGLLNMYQALSNDTPLNIALFEDRGDAERWLFLDLGNDRN